MSGTPGLRIILKCFNRGNLSTQLFRNVPNLVILLLLHHNVSNVCIKGQLLISSILL